MYNNLHITNIIPKLYEDVLIFNKDMAHSYFSTSGLHILGTLKVINPAVTVCHDVYQINLH